MFEQQQRWVGYEVSICVPQNRHTSTREALRLTTGAVVGTCQDNQKLSDACMHPSPVTILPRRGRSAKSWRGGERRAWRESRGTEPRGCAWHPWWRERHRGSRERRGSHCRRRVSDDHRRSRVRTEYPPGGTIPIPRPAGMPRPGPAGSYITVRASESEMVFLDSCEMSSNTHHIFLVVILNWRRSFHRQGHDCFSTEDDEPQGPLHLLLGASLCLSWLLLWPNTSELFTIGKNKVHMPVKGKHLADESASIVDRNLQPPINQAKHFPTFRFRRRL
jgi:hypothetical protein